MTETSGTAPEPGADLPATDSQAADILPAARPAWERLVTPGYLAGPGTVADDAFNPLTGQAGWQAWSDDLANCHLTSPCGRAYLGFLPEANPEPVGLWKAWARPDHHSPRTWMAAFDDYVPYEYIGAFTSAWAAAYRPDSPRIAGPRTPVGSDSDRILAIARAAGWDLDHATRRTGRVLTRLTAPDGRAAIELRTPVNSRPEDEILNDRAARWTVWAAPAPYRRPLWEAVFSTATPADLIAAFVT